MPLKTDETIAWHLWHTTRIEDLVGNLLIAGQKPILDAVWLDRLGTRVTDTGNSMTDDEIIAFSRQVDKQALLAYRAAVGRQTRSILHTLTPESLKHKPAPENADRIMEEGGLLPDKGSFWLKDFWAKKTIAGLIILPITRHHFIHLPDSLVIKNKIKDGLSNPFLSGY